MKDIFDTTVGYGALSEWHIISKCDSYCEIGDEEKIGDCSILVRIYNDGYIRVRTYNDAFMLSLDEFNAISELAKSFSHK